MATLSYLNKTPRTIFGFTGPVSSGKTECTHNLTGKWTTQYSDERKRNMSRKSGYAGLKIFKDNNNKLYSTDSSIDDYTNVNDKLVSKELGKIFKNIKNLVKTMNRLLKDYNIKKKYKYNIFKKEKNTSDKSDIKLLLSNIKKEVSEIIKFLSTIPSDNDVTYELDDYKDKFNNIQKELDSKNDFLNLRFELVNHYSIIDCPGHYEVMDTMLSNVDIMKNTIVIMSAALSVEKQPQLKQHLSAIKLANIDNIIVCINKVDLVPINTLMKVKEELEDLLEQLEIVPKIIIPTAFKKKIGHQYLLDNIVKFFDSDSKNKKSNDNLIGQISRSFDINKSNKSYKNSSGGAIGGSIISGGPLKIGDTIEIRPGFIIKKKKSVKCKPLVTSVVSIKTEKISLEEAYIGSLIGVCTLIDPFYCKSDQLVGNVFGLQGQLPDVYYPDIHVKFKICKELGYDWKIRTGDEVNFQVGTMTLEKCILKKILQNTKKYKCAIFELSKPCCLEENSNIIISKKSIEGVKMIIANGNMVKGDKIELV
jgi:translation initiation factor 2 subunit 3